MNHEVNEAAKRIIGNEVFLNLTGMVSALLGDGQEQIDVYEFANYRLDPDKLTLSKMKELLDEQAESGYARGFDFNPWVMNQDELRAWVEAEVGEVALDETKEALLAAVVAEMDQFGDNYENELQGWKNAVSELPDAEVYEWWAVSSFLARELEEAGEVVGEAFGVFLFGRQGTGQALYLDSTFQELGKARVGAQNA
jgi:hypothetical protein